MRTRINKAFAAGCLMACFLALPITASANEPHGRGHIQRPPGRTIYYYPNYYPYGWAWDWGWGGYWGPNYGSNVYYPVGQIKLEQVDKHDQVFLNGSFLGNAGDVKTMKLAPGSYTLGVKHNGMDVINEQVYVTNGQTLKLTVGDKKD
jgi:hypothetical protein